MTSRTAEASPLVYTRVAGVAYLGIVFGLWLLFKGIDLQQWERYA